MATPQLSPGVLIREVDLTVGRAENVLDNIGAIAGPFSIGPVLEPINISNERELLEVFGRPNESNFEYWMSASSYLSYGGVLKAVRIDSTELNNSNVGVGVSFAIEAKIKNFDDYNSKDTTGLGFYFCAKNPGTWANRLKVCFIDDVADQIIDLGIPNISSLGVEVGVGVTTPRINVSIPRDGTIETFNGYLKAIITEVRESDTNSSISVKILSRVSSEGVETPIQYSQNNSSSSIGLKSDGSFDDLYFNTSNGSLLPVDLDGSVKNFTFSNTTVVESEENEIYQNVSSVGGSGSGATFNVQRDGDGDIESVGLVFAGSNYEVNDTVVIRGSSIGGVDDTDDLVILITEVGTLITSVNDWYNQQTLGLENSTIFWRSIADKPVSSNYALERNGSGDGLHIVVVDDTGLVSGISGNILEKHLNLSKAIDAISDVNSPTKTWYVDYLANFSNYIFAGTTPSEVPDNFHQTSPKATGFSSGFIPFTISDGIWGLNAVNSKFNAIGNKTYSLLGGSDYGESGATLSGLSESYDLFSNRNEIGLDFLIYGPSLPDLLESQAKANKLIAIANQRKDCIAVISPYKQGVVNVSNAESQTNNIIRFFSSLSSSSYAVFDSGYKYTYDRFNNKFRYIPCNADIAGLMARTSLLAFPWFSPAGQQRGILNNAIKLAYNPNKDQRDRLYTARVNSIVNQPGIGILLFGDKTALGYASAFDRINVRRLFLTVQQALEAAADAQLFELNDEITRSNFVNIVDPFLRDIQAKRGVFDFRVICDETNNTPDVIDNNEFRADIFLKPARSINYVTLTFVATRTGVSFEEVVGNV
jgi:hypothetical protein